MKINDKQVGIDFDHIRSDDPDRFRATTLCTLQVDRWSVTGYAVCHPTDNFCKENGRKVALTRALAVAGLEKDERKAIWFAYFNRGQIGG